MNNQSQSNSTAPIDFTQMLLANLQVNKYTDALYVYLVVPMGSLGSLFNLLSFLIFCKKSFDTIPLFKYLKVYTLASLIVSVSLIFVFNLAPYTFPAVLLAYTTRIYVCKTLASFVTSFFFFFENTLDVFINLERALCFGTGFREFKKVSPYVISLLLFFLCVLINGPVYFVFDIVEDSQLPSVLRICKLTQFSKSSFGKLFLMISYMLQGPVLLICVIGSNIIALISFRRFLKRKAQLQAQTPIENETKAQKKKRIQDEKTNKKLFFMTFYLSIFSVLNHLMVFTSQFIIFILTMSPSVTAWIVFIYIFNFAFKNLMNIFFFYNFNKKFKNSLLSYFKKSQN